MQQRGTLGTLVVSSGVLCLALLLLPLRQSGLSRGADVDLHIGNVVESAYLLRHNLPTWDWLPDIAGGYGGPNYLYYGHLGFLLPASLVNLAFNPATAIRITVALFFFVAAISSFLWCHKLGGLVGGVMGTVLYLWGPYFFGLPYIRGAYPEFFAASLYPLVLYLLSRWLDAARIWDLVLAGLVLALIVAMHTLSLLLFLPWCILYLVLLAPAHTRSRTAVPALVLFIGVFAAIALPYLIGPCFETNKIAAADHFDNGDDFAANGIPWSSLLNRYPVAGNIPSHMLPGRLHLVVLALALGTCLIASRRLLLWPVLLSLAALFLVTPTGTHLAQSLFAPVRYLQFPWRLLSIFNVFCSAAAAMLARELFASRPMSGMALATALSVLCCAYYSPLIPEQTHVAFKLDTRDSIRNSLTTLDHENKYLPRGTKLPKRPRELEILSIAGDAKMTPVMEGLNEYAYDVDCPSDGEAIFRQFWFPGWEASVDGQEVRVSSEERTGGLCRFDVPSGTRHVKVWFAAPWPYRVSRVLSYLIFLGVPLGLGLRAIVGWLRPKTRSLGHTRTAEAA